MFVLESPRVVLKGIAALGNKDDICADARAVGATWLYQWWTHPAQCDGIETIPMIRDRSMVGKPVAPSLYLLMFNEPDCPDPSQACLTIDEAVELHRHVDTDPQYAGRLVVSPATSQNTPMWLAQFRAEYYARWGEYPRWHAIAVHCYFASDDMVDGCIAQMKFHAANARAWNVELWVTEFSAVSESDADAERMERAFIAYLESEQVVTRYAHFTNRWQNDWGFCPDCLRMRLVDEKGNLTNLGKVYQEK